MVHNCDELLDGHMDFGDRQYQPAVYTLLPVKNKYAFAYVYAGHDPLIHSDKYGNADCHGDQDQHYKSFRNLYAHEDYDRHAYQDPHLYPDRDSHGNTYSFIHAVKDADCHAYADIYAGFERDVYGNKVCHGHRHQDSHRDAHAHCVADADFYVHRNPYPVTHFFAHAHAHDNKL